MAMASWFTGIDVGQVPTGWVASAGLNLDVPFKSALQVIFALVQSTAAAVAIEQYASRLAGRIAAVSQFFLRMDSLLPFFVPPCVDLRSGGQRTLLSLMTSCRPTAAREPRACGNHFPAAEPSCFTPSFETVSTRIQNGSKPTSAMASSTFFAYARQIAQAACLATVTCSRGRQAVSG